MELFIDDPNTDVDSEDRNLISSAYYLALFTSIIPGLNLILPFLYLKNQRNKNSFINKHFSNLLNLQILVIIAIIVALFLFLIVGLFYFLLFVLFIILFQFTYIYVGLSASKNGNVNELPFSLGLFKN